MATRCALAWFTAVLLGTNLGAASDLRVLDAVKAKDAQVLQRLLKSGADVNATQPDGATALHWAAHLDDQDAADRLIKAGARAAVADDHGVTPLWLASLNGSAPMIQLLLSAGADPNAAMKSGETPLMTASRAGKLAAVKLLLAHGANVNAKQGSRQQTALMWAVAQQHPDVVQALVDAGADLDSRTVTWHETVTSGTYRDESHFYQVEDGGYAALTFAARNGDVASATILLAAGANVNETVAAGMSALVVAIHSGHDEVASLLIDKGADVNAMGAGYSALHIAVRRGELKPVESLISHGADVHARLLKATPTTRTTRRPSLHYSWVGATPYWIAARLANVELMRLLKAHGADPAANARDGTTTLMAPLSRFPVPAGSVREKPALEAVKLAIEYGGDIHATNDDGDTPLHLAAWLGWDTVVQFLVDNGARIDAKNKKGKTPLAMTSAHTGEFQGSDTVVERKTTAELLRKLGAKE
jgi:ankyrin repeat protein